MIAKELICTTLSALLFYFSLGPANDWPLAWLAPVPLLWLAFGDTPVWRLLAFSFLAYLIGQSYVAQCYVGAPLGSLITPMELRPILFPLCILLAHLLYRRASPLLVPVAFAASSGAMEFAAAHLSFHGSYGSIAYTQVSAPILVQSASLFGMYSITFVLSLFAAALALALRNRKAALSVVSLAAAVCGADLVFGAIRMAPHHTDTVRVAALGPIAPWEDSDSASTDRQSVATYATSLEDLAEGGAQLLVTPEESMTAQLDGSAAVYAPLAAVAQHTGAEIIAGVLQREPAGDIAVAFTPDGHSLRYAKRHRLLPFEARFPPGTSPGLLGSGWAMAICKDMDFPDTIRKDAQSGLRLMAVPAWDSDVDGWIHGRMAILRGVENGFALIRAANHGLLTASDAQGRLIASAITRVGPTDWLVAVLPLGPGPTLYTRIGNVFPWALVALTLLASALALRVKSRDRRNAINT